jgi:hypothetical protein
MKKLILLLILFTLKYGAAGQDLVPEVVASAGAFDSGGNASLSWTLGEVCGETFHSGAIFLTQGFQQPLLFTTSVIDPASSYAITAFPNPSSGIVTIRFAEGTTFPLKLEIKNAYGLQISSMTVSEPEYTLDVDAYASGYYFLVIHAPDRYRQETLMLVKI